jgi:hypothetical protein
LMVRRACIKSDSGSTVLSRSAVASAIGGRRYLVDVPKRLHEMALVIEACLERYGCDGEICRLQKASCVVQTKAQCEFCRRLLERFREEASERYGVRYAKISLAELS